MYRKMTKWLWIRLWTVCCMVCFSLKLFHVTAFVVYNHNPTTGHGDKWITILPWTLSSSCSKTTCRWMAGFGNSSSSSSSKNKKKKGKRKGRLSNILTTSPKKKEEEEEEASPQLDRFGLPLPTLDTIFPPLPPETELLPAATKQTSLKDIQQYMSQHIPLNWDLFDEHGLEKKEKSFNSNNPWKLKLLYASPPVLAVENFFTKEECEEYKNLALESSSSNDDGLLEVNSATFSPLSQSKRTSTTWYCHFRNVPTLLAKAKRLLNLDSLDTMEEPQIVRYQTGQEFSWHYDEIPAAQLDNGGQRTATLLVYLNTLPSSKDGGGTVFRDLKTTNDGQQQLTMKPKQGSALLFFPSFANGTPDDRTLHKGEVVTSTKDTKMIAQMWFHQRLYQPILPEGNSHNDATATVEEKEKELKYI